MLIIIGHASYDEIINNQQEVSIIPSGAGYIGALGASLIQKNVGLVSRVGKDYDMSLLTRLGIDLTGVHQITNGLTTRFILSYHYDDPLQRDFEAEFNVGADINPCDVPDVYVRYASHIHLATMPPQQQEQFIDFFREANPEVKMSIDTIEQFIETDYDMVIRNFARCDTLFMDRRESEKLPPSLIANKRVILKLGHQGAMYIEGDQTIPVPTRPIYNIKDKTGSGDVLAGVFLACQAFGVEDPEMSLRIGCEIATRSVEKFGVDHLLEGVHNPWKEKL